MADSTHHNPSEKNTDKNVIPVEPSATADSDQAEGEGEGENKENGEKKNEAQQSVSMANYFVCAVRITLIPSLTFDQRILSYTSRKDRVVLAVGMISAVASGVVC